jgi:hypothetical protein
MAGQEPGAAVGVQEDVSMSMGNVKGIATHTPCSR